ncbi:uncharacterized protein LOC133192418 [Saccostrea echinata]|uniref:uncharacterized protein LOC133192418 n=1 Tax=Saccostrea echinata TaxID=191078 RepID=UPI002A80D8D3|nr:uncharacterized protein LOC133192418 [Saccostrea echinata]
MTKRNQTLFLVFLCAADVALKGVDIIAPSVIVLQRGGLEIMCRPSKDKDEIEKVTNIILLSNKVAPFTSSVSQIARAVTKNKNDTMLNLYWTDRRYQLTGKTGNPTTAYLRLAVSRADVSCEDSARYRCQMEAMMADGSVKTYIKDTQISISATETLIYDSMKVYPRSHSTTPYGQYPLNTELTLSCAALVERESKDLTWCIYRGYSTKAQEYDAVKRTRVKMNKPCAYHLLSEIQYVLNRSNVFTWIICKFGPCNTLTDKSNVFSVFTYSQGYRNISDSDILLSTVLPSNIESSSNAAKVISVISIVLVLLLIFLVMAALWIYKFRISKGQKITLKNWRTYFRSKSIESVSESCQTEVTTTTTPVYDIGL